MSHTRESRSHRDVLTLSAQAEPRRTSLDTNCDHCGNTRWIVHDGLRDGRAVTWTEPCACAVAMRRRRVLGRFAEARFSQLEADVAAYGRVPHASLLAARDRMAAHPTGSFLLIGDYRGWKTYLVAAQWNALIEIHEDARALFLDDFDLYRSLREAELGGQARITPEDINADRLSHLIIDDLGKKDISTFIRRAYFDLINVIHRRGDVGLTITTNFGLDALAYGADGQEIYDPGMIRRIEDLCERLVISASPKR